MKKIKRIKKKLPKYYNGELAVSVNDVIGSNPQLTPPSAPQIAGKGMPANQVGGAITGGAQLLTSSISNVKRSRENGVSFGSVLGGVGSGAAMGASLGSVIPGIGTAIGAVAGGVIGGITSAVGRSGNVDINTGEVTKSDGLTRLFGWGRNDRSLWEKSKRIKGTLAAKEVASNAKEEYAQDTDNFENKNIFATAAEGGIMRRPVEALVSKGELIYDPIEKTLIKVPGNNGKANTDDDVYTVLEEGKIVLPNSNNSKKLTTNGKTLAYNLEPMIDKPNKKMSKGTIEARDRIIKKAALMNETIKGESQYAMYGDGTGKDGAERKTLFDQRGRNSTLGKWLMEYDQGQADKKTKAIQQFLDFVEAGGEYRTNKYGAVEIKKDGKWYNYQDTFDFDTRDLASVNSTKSAKYVTPDVLKQAEYLKGNYGINIPEKTFNGIDKSVMSNVSNAIASYNPVDFYYPDNENKNNVKKVTQSSTQSAPAKIDKSVLDKAMSKFETPTFHTDYTFSKAGNYVPIKEMEIDPTEVVDELPLPGAPGSDVKDGKTGNSFDWNNALGYAAQALSAISPLLQKREKPDPVNYKIPSLKQLPTSVDVSNQLSDADDTFATQMYNMSRINPSTGANRSYGLQAGINRNKQRSAIRQWQSNEQNRLIGLNADMYNRWSENYANIMNNVYDKVAANKAAARNINRQNLQQAIKNVGQLGRDLKQEQWNNRVYDMYKKTFEV